MPVRLPADVKLKLIKQVLSGKKISDVCRKARISRTIFYKWLKKYQTASPGIKLQALSDQIKRGKNHWKSTNPKLERQILKLALKNPSLSIQKIAATLDISPHGVWNILQRQGLNTRSLREAYIYRNGTSLIKPLDLNSKMAILRRFEVGEKVTDLCQEFKISRPTFYKWIKRYQKAQRNIESLASD